MRIISLPNDAPLLLLIHPDDQDKHTQYLYMLTQTEFDALPLAHRQSQVLQTLKSIRNTYDLPSGTFTNEEGDCNSLTVLAFKQALAIRPISTYLAPRMPIKICTHLKLEWDAVRGNIRSVAVAHNQAKEMEKVYLEEIANYKQQPELHAQSEQTAAQKWLAVELSKFFGDLSEDTVDLVQRYLERQTKDNNQVDWTKDAGVKQLQAFFEQQYHQAKDVLTNIGNQLRAIKGARFFEEAWFLTRQSEQQIQKVALLAELVEDIFSITNNRMAIVEDYLQQIERGEGYSLEADYVGMDVLSLVREKNPPQEVIQPNNPLPVVINGAKYIRIGSDYFKVVRDQDHAGMYWSDGLYKGFVFVFESHQWIAYRIGLIGGGYDFDKKPNDVKALYSLNASDLTVIEAYWRAAITPTDSADLAKKKSGAEAVVNAAGLDIAALNRGWGYLNETYRENEAAKAVAAATPIDAAMKAELLAAAKKFKDAKANYLEPIKIKREIKDREETNLRLAAVVAEKKAARSVAEKAADLENHVIVGSQVAKAGGIDGGHMLDSFRKNLDGILQRPFGLYPDVVKTKSDVHELVTEIIPHHVLSGVWLVRYRLPELHSNGTLERDKLGRLKLRPKEELKTIFDPTVAHGISKDEYMRWGHEAAVDGYKKIEKKYKQDLDNYHLEKMEYDKKKAAGILSPSEKEPVEPVKKRFATGKSSTKDIEFDIFFDGNGDIATFYPHMN